MDNMQGGLRLPKAILRQTKAIHRKSIFEARGKPNPFLRSGLEWREKSLWENCRGSWSREASHPDCQVAPGAPATGRQSTFSLSRFPAQIHAKIDTQIHVQIQIWYMQIQIQIWNLAFICVSSLSSGRNSSSNSLGIHIQSDSLLSSFSTSHILLFTSSLILKWLSRHHWNLQRSRSGSELGWSETGKTKVHVETNTKTNTTVYNCLWTWIYKYNLQTIKVRKEARLAGERQAKP